MREKLLSMEDELVACLQLMFLLFGGGLIYIIVGFLFYRPYQWLIDKVNIKNED